MNTPLTPIAPQSPSELRKKLSDEILLRFGYVPFIIAGVAWDYAANVADASVYGRITETKKYVRTLRALRLRYDQFLQSNHFTDRQRRQQEVNMIALQDTLSVRFSAEYAMYVSADKLSDNENMRTLRASVQMCRAVLDSMLLYTATVTDYVTERTGVKPGAVLPQCLDELRTLMALIAKSLKCPELPFEHQDKFARNLAKELVDAEFVLYDSDGNPDEYIVHEEPVPNPIKFHFTLEGAHKADRSPSEPKQVVSGTTAQVSDKTRLCAVCGKPFEPRSHNHKYCCRECAAKAKKSKTKKQNI